MAIQHKTGEATDAGTPLSNDIDPVTERTLTSEASNMPVSRAMDRREVISGCLMGMAVADALGVPREGLSPRRARCYQPQHLGLSARVPAPLSAIYRVSSMNPPTNIGARIGAELLAAYCHSSHQSAACRVRATSPPRGQRTPPPRVVRGLWAFGGVLPKCERGDSNPHVHWTLDPKSTDGSCER